MIIDVHCHYALSRRRPRVADRFTFEPADGDEPCYDSCLSPRFLARLSWRLMRWYHKLDASLEPGDALDEHMELHFARQLLAPGPIDRYVLLAFDAYHDDDGRRPGLPVRARDRGSDMITTNSLVRDLCRRHPERFLFGASVHPYREHAVDCVDEVFAAGACLLKWLPLHQNIDVRDPRTVAVLRRCGQLRLPVLVHYGEEFTLATQRPDCVSIAPFLDALRQLRRQDAMPPTIVAHVATPVMPWGERRSHRLLLDALTGEFADAPLYADVSALTTPTKVQFLRRLARRQELHAKLLFGTDFPVPVTLWALRRDLGREYARIRAEPSIAQQVPLVLRAMGFNEIVLHRAADLLHRGGSAKDEGRMK